MDTSLHTLIEKTRKIGTWAVDVDSSLCEWSPGTYEIHEEDPGKVIRLEDALTYYVPEHRPIVEKCVQEGIVQREPWDLELQIQTTTGRLRWVRAIGEPVFEEDRLVRFQGIFEDIDERKSLELEREELLRRVIEGERIATLGHWWWSADSDSYEWSRGAYLIHGVSENDPPPSFSEYFTLIHPDDRERVRTVRHEAITQGTRFEVEFRLDHGGTHKYIRTEGSPRLDAEGQVTGFAGVIVERTKEIQAQIRIEELNRRLVLALEASNIGVWEWDVVDNELIWDSHMYQLYGVPEDRFSGAYEAWESALHPDDKLEAVATIERCLADRTKFEATFRVILPDGSIRTIQGIADLLLDPAGKPLRMVGVNWDITDSVRIRRELERSNEELAQFAYRTSHDLKSPLTAIRRLANYMQQDIEAGALEDVATNVAAIEQRVAAMEDMVRGILDTAKADLTSAQPEPIDIESIVREVAESHSVLSEEHNVQLTWSVDCPDQPTLTRMRVYQILANLVANGIKYSVKERDPSFVKVNVASREGRILMTVEDNGAGMPDADSDRPYEMFARFHSGVSGSGLGLYIVRKHVDALTGKIGFETSESGTRFDIDLPLHLPSPQRALP